MDDPREQSFLEAYDKYADDLFRHAFFRVYGRERAEELVQEAFLKTWEYLVGGHEVQNLRAFLYKVLNNLIIDYSRKKREDSLEAMLEARPDLEPGRADPKLAEPHFVWLEVIEVIKQLPEEAGQFLVMRYVDGLQPREIARITGQPVNNVSVKISRALAQLKKLLHE